MLKLSISDTYEKQPPVSRYRQLVSEINEIYETEALDEDSEEENYDVEHVRQSNNAADEEEEEEEYCVQCTPIVPDTYAGTKLSHKGRCCQICQYEGCGVQQSNVVMCTVH